MLSGDGLNKEIGHLECISGAITDFVSGTDLQAAWEKPQNAVEQLENNVKSCAGNTQ